MKIKLDKCDILFSKGIRLRDKECVRCHGKGEMNKEGLPIGGLQCSHYFGRGRESTRFDEKNCDSLCYGCHQYWGSVNREEYRDFKIKQLGENGFNILTLRFNQYKKKDRKLEYIKIKKWFECIKNNYEKSESN